MPITIEKLSDEDLKERGVYSWPIWTKEVSRFDWSYDSIEECLFLEGEVTVESPGNPPISFGTGDFVTFPKGLTCTWVVKQPVKKHYNFR